MGDKTDVWQGTLALMVLKTLETLGPLHGYGIARRIEQTSGELLALNYGTLYPALLKLEQEGYIASEWGVSDNNRKAKFYRLTRAGRRQVERRRASWEQATAILARFLRRGENSVRPLRGLLAAAARPLRRGTRASGSSPRSSRAICSCTSTTTCAPAWRRRGAPRRRC